MRYLLLPLFLLGCSGAGVAPTQSVEDRNQYEATGQDYMIATQGKAASVAAKEMFEKGGNSIDAAVAASFVISVERPQSTGLGGGGFLLFREAKTKKVYAVDFRERAPFAAKRDMYLDEKRAVIEGKSLNGIHAVAVPGLVAGLLEIHKKFGRLPLKQVMAPAIELAEGGLIVYPRLFEALNKRREVLAKYPASAAIFLKSDGSVFQVGEKIIQKDLAKSLRLIAAKGRKAFYQGALAQSIVAEAKRQGGILKTKDFSNYKVKWRTPVTGTFRDYSLYSMPPPSSGGIHVVQILNILEKDSLTFHSVDSIHRTASAFQLAFADRSEYLGDPDFYKVPQKKLLSKTYAETLHSTIDPNHARPSQSIKPGAFFPEESKETTHFSIIDKEGNAVASTQTINYLFGSGVVAAGTGILLNDEMDDFSVKPGVPNVFGAIGGDANAIEPRKTPLSSMSPTIVLKNQEPVLVLGAPGGTRIITCVTQVILNYLVYGQPLYEAVANPRFHHQWIPDRLDFDSPGPGDATVQKLKAMGYQVNVANDAVGCRVEAVAREGSVLRGVADPRDLGSSLGR